MKVLAAYATKFVFGACQSPEFGSEWLGESPFPAGIWRI